MSARIKAARLPTLTGVTAARVIATLVIVTLAGCSLGSIGKPVPQPATYAIAVRLPATPAAALRRTQTLRVGSIRVAAAYAASALVYRTSDVRVISDPYSQLITEPGPMLEDEVAAWLEHSGPFRSVAHPHSTRPTDYVLEGTVTELYGDFRPHARPAAVVTMQFALIDEAAPRRRSVFEREISRRADLRQASPDALVRGYGEALSGILTELTASLQSFGGSASTPVPAPGQ